MALPLRKYIFFAASLTHLITPELKEHVKKIYFFFSWLERSNGGWTLTNVNRDLAYSVFVYSDS